MIFEPGNTYWTLDQETYDLILELLEDEGASILADFEKVGDTYYATYSSLTSAEYSSLEDIGFLPGQFIYRKSTQSTSPV